MTDESSGRMLSRLVWDPVAIVAHPEGTGTGRGASVPEMVRAVEAGDWKGCRDLRSALYAERAAKRRLH